MPKITEEKGKPERTVTGKNAYRLLRCSAPFLFHWSALTPMEIHQLQEGGIKLALYCQGVESMTQAPLKCPNSPREMVEGTE